MKVRKVLVDAEARWKNACTRLDLVDRIKEEGKVFGERKVPALRLLLFALALIAS